MEISKGSGMCRDVSNALCVEAREGGTHWLCLPAHKCAFDDSGESVVKHLVKWLCLPAHR